MYFQKKMQINLGFHKKKNKKRSLFYKRKHIFHKKAEIIELKTKNCQMMKNFIEKNPF